MPPRQRLFRLLLPLLAAAGCSKCAAPPGGEDPPPVGASASASIGAAGGEVRLGALSVRVGEGALPGDTELRVTVQSIEAPDGLSPYSPLYRFEPAGLQFAAPVEVRLPFASERPELAQVFWSLSADDTAFEPLDTRVEGNVAVTQVTHFSLGLVAHACSLGRCGCTTDAQCARLDDGNRCNGLLACDLATSTCRVKPGSVVTCSTTGDTGCLHAACDPGTGKCGPVPMNEGGACEDENLCTTGDTCHAGACVSGKKVCQCVDNADCAQFEDGDLCNGTLYCHIVAGAFPYQCEVNPASVKSCPTVDDNVCQTNTCQPLTGECALQFHDGTPCTEGNACTVGDTCQGGTCVSGTQNLCQCQGSADCAPYEDGNLCNGVLYCQYSAFPYTCELNTAKAVTCPTANDTACMKNTCNPATGGCALAPANEGGDCNPGYDVCRAWTCHDGGCLPGPSTCECEQDADCAEMEDGNLCNGTLYCNKGSVPFRCVVNPATVKGCPGVNDTACRKNTCDPASGACAMTNVSDGTACDLGDGPCTADSCQAGTCTASASACMCMTDADCFPYNSGDRCNGTQVCRKSSFPWYCATNPATVVSCDDGNPCTWDSCDQVTTACSHGVLPAGTPCNGGSKCDGAGSCL